MRNYDGLLGFLKIDIFYMNTESSIWHRVESVEKYRSGLTIRKFLVNYELKKRKGQVIVLRSKRKARRENIFKKLT